MKEKIKGSLLYAIITVAIATLIQYVVFSDPIEIKRILLFFAILFPVHLFVVGAFTKKAKDE